MNCENGTQPIPQLTSATIKFSDNLSEIYLQTVLAHTIFQFIGIFVQKGDRSLSRNVWHAG